jgi:electron transfer flavoprotein alpha/beta subunit
MFQLSKLPVNRLNGMSIGLFDCLSQATEIIMTEPRYASLPNIMKAKKKPLEKITPQDLGIDLTPRLEVLQFQEPPKRVGGGKVSSL